MLEEKGGRSVKTLWTKVLTLLPTSVVPQLSDFVIDNLEEAGKCWVVDRLTATGFHVMRSVECVLRQYAELVTGAPVYYVGKYGIMFDGFGTILNKLDKELTNLKSAKTAFGQLEFIVGILRPLCKLYRDPLAHPELKKLDDDEAKEAFEHGISAISRMVQDAITGGAHFKTALAAGTRF